jgi:S-adenosylmethionine:tRNA ribosyltransferase-isomerase
MTTTLAAPPFDFVLDAAHEASEPPEQRGLPRDGVRLLVSEGERAPVDATFRELPRFLRAGDVVAVNVSSTIPAALDGRLPDGEPVVVHYSGELPGGVALVEVRSPDGGASRPRRINEPVAVTLHDGRAVVLLTPFAPSARLWIARLDVGEAPVPYLARHGRAIRYRHVVRDWPIAEYQTVFGSVPGSAEMPSAGRPFTDRLVTRLVTAGVGFAPLLLHTGVSSLEGDEAPYPERYEIPATTAAAVNAARRRGGCVVAAGTTVVRALASTTDADGLVHPGSGWTDVFVDAAHPVPSVDGLITGWHEPESTHLQMLRAFASARALEAAYGRALELGFRWHEFGDSHLILSGPAA